MQFTIPDMSCGGCLKAITRVVQSADAQATVEADLASKIVQVKTAEEEAALRARLAEAGYPPA